ncbi:MAG TPA: hypothetical protein DDW45_02175 [Gammaproteobacteria bacterium]|nr:hypothetical protein [Gammaproteobacteria bacterium]
MSNTAAAALDEREQQDGNRDAAWASINTSLSPQELLSFCQEDVERLFRINPYLEFRHWVRLDDTRYSFSGRNSSQQKPFDFDVELQVDETPDGVHVHYKGGLKRETIFQIDSSTHGSKLTIHENYPPLDEDEREQKLGEVDQSLTTWAGDIQKFLVMWKQWGWLAPWRWYMRNVWRRMKPSGRRIAYMFWWITLVEIVLIVLGTGIYLAEYS